MFMINVALHIDGSSQRRDTNRTGPAIRGIQPPSRGFRDPSAYQDGLEPFCGCCSRQYDIVYVSREVCCYHHQQITTRAHPIMCMRLVELCLKTRKNKIFRGLHADSLVSFGESKGHLRL